MLCPESHGAGYPIRRPFRLADASACPPSLATRPTRPRSFVARGAGEREQQTTPHRPHLRQCFQPLSCPTPQSEFERCVNSAQRPRNRESFWPSQDEGESVCLDKRREIHLHLCRCLALRRV